MSNKITSDSVNAFLEKRNFARENMHVVKSPDAHGTKWYLLLHGNVIAKMVPDGSIYISTCGWHTRTTLMRLNHLLYALGSTTRIRMKNFEPWLVLDDGSKHPYDDGLMVRFQQYTVI